MNYFALIFITCFFSACMSFPDVDQIKEKILNKIREQDKELLEAGKKLLVEIATLQQQAKSGALNDPSKVLEQIAAKAKILVDSIENYLREGYEIPDLQDAKKPGVIDAETYKKQFAAIRSMISELKQKNRH